MYFFFFCRSSPLTEACKCLLQHLPSCRSSFASLLMFNKNHARRHRSLQHVQIVGVLHFKPHGIGLMFAADSLSCKTNQKKKTTLCLCKAFSCIKSRGGGEGGRGGRRGRGYLSLHSPDLQKSSNLRISMKYLKLLFYPQCVGQDNRWASMT